MILLHHFAYQCNSLTMVIAAGKIARVHKIKELGDIKYKYDIDYDDGDKDKLIPEDLIFPLEDKSEEPSLPDETDEEAKPPFEEGDKVEAQFRGRPRMRFYRKCNVCC